MDAPHVDLSFNRFQEYEAFGPAQEKLARVAARRAFVELKNGFMRAAADIEGNVGAVIQHEVRRSSQVIELWRLRRALFDALADSPRGAEAHRRELMQLLDDALADGAGRAAS